MVESAVTQFTTKMTELLQIEREAEMEQTADILAQYSFRVSTLLHKIVFLTFCIGVCLFIGT